MMIGVAGVSMICFIFCLFVLRGFLWCVFFLLENKEPAATLNLYLTLDRKVEVAANTWDPLLVSPIVSGILQPMSVPTLAFSSLQPNILFFKLLHTSGFVMSLHTFLVWNSGCLNFQKCISKFHQLLMDYS